MATQDPMNPGLQILMIEDSAEDATLILRELNRHGYQVTHSRAQTAEEMRAALQRQNWDIILCDYSLPHFSGRAALQLAKEYAADAPFIYVSGTIGEDTAVEAMKSGAQDYVMKDRLGRLGPAVQRELSEAQTRREAAKAERALRDSEQKYRHLFERLSDAAFLIAEETGCIVETNLQGELLLGRSRSAILGLRQPVLSASTELSVGLQLPGCDALDRENETQILRQDGSSVPVRIFASRFNLDGRPLILVLARDLSELKQTEKALRERDVRIRRLVESNIIGIIFWTLRGDITEANDAFLQLVAYSREDLRAGRLKWNAMSVPESREADLRAIDELRRTGVCTPYEREFLSKGGQRIPVLIGAALLEKSEEAGVGFVLDLSQRKAAEEEIRRFNRELEAKVEKRTGELRQSLEKEALLRKEIHHRVKNNLQVISSLLFLQSLHVSDARTLEVLRESQMRTRSIALIHEKLYQGNDPTKIEFASYARQLALALFDSYQANSAALKLTIRAEGVFLGLDAAIPCGLILTELLSNVLKHAFPEGAEGEVTVAFQRAENRCYEFCVRDNGVGLPFGLDLNQLPSLGLRLVRDLTRQLNGKVEFRNEGGTHVVITIPEGQLVPD